jgi:Fe-Mn family superoxide dismutase
MDRRTAIKSLGITATTLAASEFLSAQATAPVAPIAAPATPAGPFTLPALPYAYDALEPYFDAETMHLHHDKHHAAYVNNLNAAFAAHPEAAQYTNKSVEELLTALSSLPSNIQTAIRNQGGGHANHSLWWLQLGTGGEAPKGELATAINKKFGSYSQFQDKFTAAATSVFGSGWAWLTLASDGTLAIETSPNQDSPLSSGRAPILCVDVWEHAYYLKYQNKRADYVKAFYKVVNWDAVSAKYAGLVKKS